MPLCESGRCPLGVLCEINQDAWHLYEMLKSRFVQDLNMAQWVFELADIKCTRKEGIELLEKLILLHNLMLSNRDKNHGN